VTSSFVDRIRIRIRIMTSEFSLSVNFQGNRYALTIDETASFSDLKTLLIELLTIHEIISPTEAVFYYVRIEYASLVQDMQRSVFPVEGSRIVNVVRRLERCGPCRLDFALADARRRSSKHTMIKQSQVSLRNAINWVPRISTNDTLNQLSFSQYPLSQQTAECLFWSLSSIAIFQGRMSRKIESGRRQDTWR
jgi:hypothetical protein